MTCLAANRPPITPYDSIYRLIGENITGDPDTAGNGALNYTLDGESSDRFVTRRRIAAAE